MLVNEISICAQSGKAHRATVKHTFLLGKRNDNKVAKAVTPVAAIVTPVKEEEKQAVEI